jgi:membrane protease YdiL (CAAX protease family)
VERPTDASGAAGPRSGPRRDGARGAALLLLGVLCAFAGAAVLERAPELPEAILLGGLAAQALFACTALGLRRIAGPALPRGLRLERPRLAPAELALLALGFVSLSHALSLVLTSLALRDTGTLAEIDRVAEAARGPSRALLLLAVGVAPALGEELLFRGLVQQAALRRLGAAAAVAISAGAFGLIHLDPVQSPAAFVLGLYLGSAVEIGRSLWAAVLCHLVNNLLAMVPIPWPFATAGAVHAAWVVGLGALGLLVPLWLARRRSIPHGDTTDPGVG